MPHDEDEHHYPFSVTTILTGSSTTTTTSVTTKPTEETANEETETEETKTEESVTVEEGAEDGEWDELCELATLVPPSLPIEPIYVRALSSQILTKQYQAFTDSVSDGYEVDNACGSVEYGIQLPANRRALQAEGEEESTEQHLDVKIRYFSLAKWFQI